jgi:putative transposase
MSKYLAPLIPDEIYHVYNRAVGSEQLFKNGENYRYFLKKFIEYTDPVCDIFCYCLLPNHFHFLLRIKNAEMNPGLTEKLKRSQPFSNFFNAYTKAFNVFYDRKGTLFMRPFKRKRVNTDEYFARLIHYIHANPVHHGYCNKIDEWKYSSYPILLNNSASTLLREEIMDWFGNVKQFEIFHQQPVIYKGEWEFEP